MMLSTHSSRRVRAAYLKSERMSASARSGLIERYPIASLFRPQNVQWARSPHQQPREVSKVSAASIPPPGKLRSSVAMNSS